MKSITGLGAACLAVILLSAGCDQISGNGSGMLVVDLAAVAKANGQEQAMQEKAQVAREAVNTQLIESGRELEQKIVDERTRIGLEPTPEAEAKLQQMAQQAQQQYAQLQADAQQQVQQNELNLVMDYRETVKPFAEKIARSRHASVVMLADQSVFWLDPAVDITGEVIDALRAADVFAKGAVDNATPAPVASPVEVPAPAAAPTE